MTVGLMPRPRNVMALLCAALLVALSAPAAAKGSKGIKGGLKENTYEELKAVAKRTPTSGSGAQLPDAKLELERKMTVKGPEAVDVGTGPQKATRVEVDLTGRAQLAVKDEKELNMPAQ